MLPKDLKNCVLGYEPICDRVMTVKLKATPVNLNIVQVYARWRIAVYCGRISGHK